MANRISVIVDVAVDKANRGLKSFKKSVNDADGAVGKFKAGSASAFASLKANALPVAAAAGAAMLSLGAKSVAAASSLEESMNAVNVVFGEAAEGIHDLGETSIESFGLSQRAFNEAAVSFAGFAQQVAGEGGDVVGVIDDLVGRATDFASVHNLELSDAMTKFQSGLAGETEAMRRYSVDISAAAVNTYALEEGLVDSTSEMTEAIKVQARYELLMRETEDTAGDFTNTQDSLANSTKTLSGQMENLYAELGEKLTPVVADAVNAINDLMAITEGAASVGNNLGISFDDVRGAVSDAINPIGRYRDLLLDTADSAGILGGDNEELTETVENLGQEYIQNERGIKAWQKTVADDKAAQAYIDHAAGMVRANEDVARAAERATQRIERAYSDMREELSDQSAYLDIEDSFASLQEAGVEAWTKTADGAEDAEQAQRDFARAQIATKNTVLDYIETLGDIPPEQTTELLAMVDRGKADEAMRTLNALAAGRTVAFRAQVFGAGAAADQLRRAGQGDIRLHSGGIAGGGKFAGDEVPAILEKGEMVLTEGQQAAVSAGLGGSGVTNYYTINALDGKSVVQALKEHERRNGPGWRQ